MEYNLVWTLVVVAVLSCTCLVCCMWCYWGKSSVCCCPGQEDDQMIDLSHEERGAGGENNFTILTDSGGTVHVIVTSPDSRRELQHITAQLNDNPDTGNPPNDDVMACEAVSPPPYEEDAPPTYEEATCSSHTVNEISESEDFAGRDTPAVVELGDVTSDGSPPDYNDVTDTVAIDDSTGRPRERWNPERVWHYLQGRLRSQQDDQVNLT